MKSHFKSVTTYVHNKIPFVRPPPRKSRSITECTTTNTLGQWKKLAFKYTAEGLQTTKQCAVGWSRHLFRSSTPAHMKMAPRWFLISHRPKSLLRKWLTGFGGTKSFCTSVDYRCFCCVGLAEENNESDCPVSEDFECFAARWVSKSQPLFINHTKSLPEHCRISEGPRVPMFFDNNVGKGRTAGRWVVRYSLFPFFFSVVPVLLTRSAARPEQHATAVKNIFRGADFNFTLGKSITPHQLLNPS